MCKFCDNKPKTIISSIKQKPDVIETVEEERCNLWKCYGAVLIVVDLSEVEK